MSNHQDPYPGKNNFVLGIAGAVICMSIAAATAIFVLVPEGENTLVVLTLLFANLGAVLPAIAALSGVNRANSKLNDVNRKTDAVLNGDMEAKIRKTLENVLTERLDER